MPASRCFVFFLTLILQDPSRFAKRHSDYLRFRALRNHFKDLKQVNFTWFQMSSSIWPEPSTDITGQSGPNLLSESELNQPAGLNQSPELQSKQESHKLRLDAAVELGNTNLGQAFSSDLTLFFNIYITSALKVGNGFFHEQSILHEAFLRSSAGSVWFTRYFVLLYYV